MPPGGDGVYYFSTYLLGSPFEFGRFDVMHGEGIICTAWPDHHEIDDYASGSCSAAIYAVSGKRCSI